MKAISLWQPWASLIFTGDKLHETRSFRPPERYVGQRIAIHAAKALPKDVGVALHCLCERQWGGGSRWREAVHRGVILGSVRLVGFGRTEETQHLTKTNLIAGDWSVGRFAWELADPIRLLDPVPFRGMQGWFDVPDDLFADD